MTDRETTLARSFGGRGIRSFVVPVLLAVSLGCNVAAVTVPFLEIDIFLKGRDHYSLPHSVKLMWEAKLYVIAVLIAGFSILFPFAKLIGLTTAWFLLRAPRWRRRVITTLESLGKWSFLDIFIVAIILVLTNRQVFISATPIMGLYLFVAAISLSMVTSMIMETLTRPRTGDGGEPVVLGSEPGWSSWIVPPLLVISLAALLAAVELPFLKISQFLFANRAYGIIHSVRALWQQDAPIVSIAVAVTLVLMPLASLGALWGLWLGSLRPRARRRWYHVARGTGHWAMLDVFGLALLLFLLEGERLVKTEVRPGLFLIVAAIVLLTVTTANVFAVARRALPESRQTGGPPAA